MTTSNAIPPITEDDIAEYLLRTPGFFERHAEVLAGVQLTSPHGQRAVSLQERQAEMLREKIKGLEQRIIEMVRHGTENAAIGQKVNQWTGRLLAVRDPFDLPTEVTESIRALFDVPLAAVRVWGVAGPYIDCDFALGASEDAQAFASSLTMPFCGPNLGFEPTQWLPQALVTPEGETEPVAHSAQSVALLPLREGPIDSATPAFGLLVLGSPDPQRFDATMGTDFLARMAELASAALLRLR